jgi:lysophospholipid acyltransferase (LPLAT)-like uncharacterized protein
VKLRVPPSAARVLAGPALKLLASSWRIRTVDEERWRWLHQARRPHVFLLWHEVLLPLLWHHRGQSIDFAASLGYRAVRGSSTRGAARALLGAVRELQGGYAVAFTPDGPRGPRREMKPGVVAAAQRGRGTIVPLHAVADRAWRLDSWDRFMIPKFGAKVRIVYGRPFEVAGGEDGLAAGLALAEARLREIVGTGA